MSVKSQIVMEMATAIMEFVSVHEVLQGRIVEKLTVRILLAQATDFA
jgi:hypothetical protein